MNVPRERRRYSLPRFYRLDSRDGFAKCRNFEENYRILNADGSLDECHRVELTGGLDREIAYRDVPRDREANVLCFDSNGYLGFQHHSSVKRAAIEAIETFGAGTPSVPLLGGTNALGRSAERKLAEFHGREDAILFSSAFAANVSLVGALVRDCDVIVHDEGVHASTLAGIRLAEPRRTLTFRTNDLGDLEAKLRLANEGRGEGDIFVFAEGVYSMEGATLDLAGVRGLCASHDAKLIVDECHSIGVLGASGRGIEEAAGLPGSIDLIVGCASKALGLLGGYIVGSADVTRYLRYLSSAYVFSTTLPPPVCAGIIAGLELIDREPEHLKRLHANVARMRDGFARLGLPTPAPGSAIFKIVIPDNRALFETGSRLLRAGLKCGVVTYPAVKEGHGILRLVVTARHSGADVDRAVEVLASVLE